MCCIWEKNVSHCIRTRWYDSEYRHSITHTQDKFLFTFFSCCRTSILSAFERRGYYMLIEFYISGDIYCWANWRCLHDRNIRRYAEDYNFKRFSLVRPASCADSKNMCAATNIVINMAGRSNPTTTTFSQSLNRS